MSVNFIPVNMQGRRNGSEGGGAAVPRQQNNNEVLGREASLFNNALFRMKYPFVSFPPHPTSNLSVALPVNLKYSPIDVIYVYKLCPDGAGGGGGGWAPGSAPGRVVG